MKFSEKWLREWVNPALNTEELCEQISMAGLEVDGVEPAAADFSGVLIGEVVECGQHPDADKLRVTKINVGADELLDIVCGAPNCRLGLKVAVACVGAVLPGDFKIKKAKLRGQPSHGMLCSFSELGISDDHDGIIELPVDAPIGKDIREYLQLDDNIIEIDLTPNRADCLGIRGVAREVGVLNQLSVSEPTVPEIIASTDIQKPVHLDAPEACPKYLSRVISGVDLSKASPLWLQEKLRRSGIRSIDPVVDVTNYVLIELGHPMHAFDASSIQGDIHVRFAKENESLVLLDESEVKVNSDTLVIADEQKALALAGIFGGLHSGVTAQSTDIVLECAFFAPDAILGKARQYGLHTDASHRYERGVDPALQDQAMARATQLLLDIVGGEAGPVFVAEAAEFVPQAKRVSLRAERLTRVVGIEFENAQVTEILERLGMAVSFENNVWQATVPAYRFDIEIEEDLIEEVARVYGYNNIPNVAPTGQLAMLPRQESQLGVNSFKSVLLQQGYDEAITYSFVDPKKQSVLFADQASLTLPHPISADMSVMRVSLITGLLDALAYNQKRQQARVRLFETGLKFTLDANSENGVAQTPMLAGAVIGKVTDENWQGSENIDFFSVKGDVERLLSLTGRAAEFNFVPTQQAHLHPGQGADIVYCDEVVGFVGALHPQFEKIFGLKSRAFVFEITLSAISQRALPKAQPVSKFPTNKRDVAIVVQNDISFATIQKSVEKVGVNQLVDLTLFDIYQGEGIAEGYKSMAMTLTFSDASKTMEDAEIQAGFEAIIAGLQSDLGATLRE
ncbi:phenylalanine--tRNA ligase subunit beta [Alteromonas sp. LMIT006]|uniref:phenylalanine--tRNA ligase subunit beta n=1 Tax=Alteromonadaceae TaxID=72275 RepID=UPI0020CA9A73|nr:phenylalanine--tRNA ligase subunit beta [Alteromonas sp. LMIT006]UTP72200.1 phenylalanine--tRNA ligase subunit beta [Alteromonas sp. LMIT006]